MHSGIVTQPIGQSGLADSGAVVGVGVRSSAPNLANTSVPILVSAQGTTTSALQFENTPMLYTTANYLPIYTSSDSGGSYYGTQGASQPGLYQTAMTVPTTIYQPFMGPVTNHAFVGTTTNQQTIFTPFANASPSNYPAQLAADGSQLYGTYEPYANGAPFVGAVESGFADQSIGYVGNQLAKTNLSGDAECLKQNRNAMGYSQFSPATDSVALTLTTSAASANGHVAVGPASCTAPTQAQAQSQTASTAPASHTGFAPDARRRRATANGDGTDSYYSHGTSRRFDYRPTHSRLRNVDSYTFAPNNGYNHAHSHSYGYRHGNGNGYRMAGTPGRKQREANAPGTVNAVFDDTDFPALNDALKPASKAKITTKNAADENGNERQCDDEQSGTIVNGDSHTPSHADAEAAEIDVAVSELTSRLRPLVDARCARPFVDCVPPPNARFFIVKSNSEDDVYRSLKYSIWCSTPHGNTRLQRAFIESTSQTHADHTAPAPVLLFFSVNGSGHFCGVARMCSPVDPAAHAGVWVSDRFTGRFDVEWLYVKDVPNAALRHIRVDYAGTVPSDSVSDGLHKTAFTHQRDCTEIGRREALEALRVMHEFTAHTTIFDDARFYEERERAARRANAKVAVAVANGNSVSSFSKTARPSTLANAETASETNTFADRHNSAPTTGVVLTPETQRANDLAKASYANIVNGNVTQPRNYAHAVLSTQKSVASSTAGSAPVTVPSHATPRDANCTAMAPDSVPNRTPGASDNSSTIS